MSSQSSLSSPSSTKSSSPISTFLTNSSDVKENNFKKSMNALKENYLRSKITKDYETLSDEINRLHNKVEVLEFENKELREINDYLNNEKKIFEDEKKEMEDVLNSEKKQIQQLQNYFNTNKELVDKLKSDLLEKENLIQELASKYSRHKIIWQENEQRSEEEIKKLDQVIDKVIKALKENYLIINNCAPLKQLLNYLTANNTDDKMESLD